MDYFEQIVARLLETRGHWVHRGVRVQLSKEDKMSLHNPSMPRPEIDIVAFDFRQNCLVLYEVKSFLDSRGVWLDGLAEQTDGPGRGRFKILTNRPYQELLKQRVKESYLVRGLVNNETSVRIGLAAGNVRPRDRAAVNDLLKSRGWEYLSPEDIAGWVRSRADEPYENDPVTLAAKLMIRASSTAPPFSE